MKLGPPHSCGDSRLTCVDCQAQVCPACMEQCPVGNRCHKCASRFTSHVTKLPMQVMVKTGAGSVAVGFIFGVFAQNLLGGFYMWLFTYILGFMTGKGLHKLASYKLGNKVIATIIGGILIGAFLSPSQGVMLGKPTPGYFAKEVAEAQIINAPVIAKKRFPEYESAFKKRQPEDKFTAKAAFDQNNVIEHLWLDVTQIDGDKLKGNLIAPAENLPGLNVGSPVTVDLKDLEDWTYYSGGRRGGGFSLSGEIKPEYSTGNYLSIGWFWLNLLLFTAGTLSPIMRVKLRN